MKNQTDKSKHTIIIDTDAGHDDVLALFLLIKSGVCNIKAITTVAGNSIIENVTRNAQFALDLLNEKEIPIYSGYPSPIERKLVTAVVHGSSGLDGVDLSKTKYFLSFNADEKIAELIKQYPKKIILITLGPLTNIARALIKYPKLSLMVKEIIIMGGAINVPGNKNRVSEFNLFVDPEAADIVFRSPIKKILIPIDICNDMFLPLSNFEELKGSSLYRPIINMMRSFIIGIEKDEGTKGALVYDAVAAYYLLNPNAFILENMDIVIETKGIHTSGMSIAEKRLNKANNLNVQVALQLHQKKFIKDFISILRK